MWASMLNPFMSARAVLIRTNRRSRSRKPSPIGASLYRASSSLRAALNWASWRSRVAVPLASAASRPRSASARLLSCDRISTTSDPTSIDKPRVSARTSGLHPPGAVTRNSVTLPMQSRPMP